MRKIAFWFLLLLSLIAIGRFAGWPAVRALVEGKNIRDTDLKPAEEAEESFAEEGWIRQVKFVYKRRDIPSLEKDFEAKGYPPFLYLAEKDGSVGRSGEKSYHEDGMAVFLFMDDTYYLTHARLEYTVPSEKFTSTAMNGNILPFSDFAGIITGKEVTAEDRERLMREFTELFNDGDHKPRTIEINDLEFTVSLDSFYLVLQMSC